ncbi:serine protease [Polynucleobacter sp. AP-Elch-400A-B2]|uniref:S1 family peptidase n=1 Tax=Polynucleobacter sp. AP-Elch-400A-B2 TaxID=2576930 RepID=UPI00352D0DF5
MDQKKENILNMGPIDHLVHCTTRIESTTKDGKGSCGTGFFMNFLEENGKSIPAIVSNKHVIKDALSGGFNLTLKGSDGKPLIGNHKKFTFNNFESLWIKHPSDKVDLAIFLLGPLLNEVKDSGAEIFFTPLSKAIIPENDVRESLSPMEDIIMIGYPSGIWDSLNNLPVIRRGVTATHPYINWNGKLEFLTDIASYPGSSGSPVLLANLNGFSDRNGNTFITGKRILLLGIHYAGAMHTAEGEIAIVTTPTSLMPIPITQIPNNIGVAINSNCLLEFEPIIKSLLPPTLNV